MSAAVGYADWALYRDLLLKATRSAISDELLRDAIRASKIWHNLGKEGWSRIQALVAFCQEKRDARSKLIIFAGYPGLANELASALGGAFGDHAVATFFAEHDMDTKEASVQRFQRDAATWLLVSDESGGEGRNFQFAEEVIHADTPWHVARVEQRI